MSKRGSSKRTEGDGLREKIEKKATALGDELRKKGQEVQTRIKMSGTAMKSKWKQELEEAEVTMMEKRRQFITGSKTKRVRDYIEENPVVKFTDKMVSNSNTRRCRECTPV
jgi:hypothetical protein